VGRPWWLTTTDGCRIRVLGPNWPLHWQIEGARVHPVLLFPGRTNMSRNMGRGRLPIMAQRGLTLLHTQSTGADKGAARIACWVDRRIGSM